MPPSGSSHNVASLPSLAIEELIPPRRTTESVLRCIGCIIGRAEEGAVINSPDITLCTGLNRPQVNNVLRDLKGVGVLEPFKPDAHLTPPPVDNQKPEFTTYLRPTVLGKRLLRIAPQPDCQVRDTFIRVTPDRNPIRDLGIKYKPEEVLDLAQRSPSVIIQGLPSQTFENGAQLLEHLNTAFYGNTTKINLVVRALITAGRKKLPENSYVQVDDIVQDALTAVLKRDKKITFPDDMPLLYTIVYRRIIDFRREQSQINKRTVFLETLNHPYEEQLDMSTPEDKIVSRALSKIIMAMKLSTVDKAILEAMAIGSERGSTISEIAKRFGKKPGSIRIAKHRLLKRIRAELEGDGEYEKV